MGKGGKEGNFPGQEGSRNPKGGAHEGPFLPHLGAHGVLGNRQGVQAAGRPTHQRGLWCSRAPVPTVLRLCLLNPPSEAGRVEQQADKQQTFGLASPL